MVSKHLSEQLLIYNMGKYCKKTRLIVVHLFFYYIFVGKSETNKNCIYDENKDNYWNDGCADDIEWRDCA